MNNFLLDNIEKEDILALKLKIDLQCYKDKSKEEILQILVQNPNEEELHHDLGVWGSFLSVKGLKLTDNRIRNFCINVGLPSQTSKKVYEVLQKKNKMAFIIKDDGIVIRADREEVHLRYEDIYYVQALEDYIIIRTQRERHIARMTMKKIEAILPDIDFIRTHRSFIVRKDVILDTKGSNVTIENNVGDYYIPIGRSYKEAVKKSLGTLRAKNKKKKGR